MTDQPSLVQETPEYRRDFKWGIALAFLLPFLGGPLMGAAFALFFRLLPSAERLFSQSVLLVLAVLFLPYVAVFMFAKRASRPGLTRGLLIGIVIQFAIGFLLLAACVGLVIAIGITNRSR